MVITVVEEVADIIVVPMKNTVAVDIAAVVVVLAVVSTAKTEEGTANHVKAVTANHVVVVSVSHVKAVIANRAATENIVEDRAVSVEDAAVVVSLEEAAVLAVVSEADANSKRHNLDLLGKFYFCI